MGSKPEETDAEETETEETETEETETEEADDDAAGWERLGTLVREVVKQELSSWSGPKNPRTTSTRLPRKQVAPKRKQGFLSGQFFSNLSPTDDDRR